MRVSTALCALAILGTGLTLTTSASARRINPKVHRPAPSATHWVATSAARPLPRHAYAAGWEPGRTLYLCRGTYKRGVHPGKVVAGRCNIGWGGREILLNRYEVLTVRRPSVMKWLPRMSQRKLRRRALRAGWEPGRELFVCRAKYRGGVHPGKIVAGRCNIGWGGREIVLSRYRVLAQKRPRTSRRRPQHVGKRFSYKMPGTPLVSL